MPGTICTCGSVVKYGEIPNPNEWLMISDEEYDQYPDTIDSEKLYMSFKHILTCSNCGSLLVYWNGFNQEPAIYNPSKE